jgi:hypothetical protein
MYKQRGMTLGGLIVLLMFLLFFVYVAFRTVPAYIDYWQVQHVMENTLTPLSGEKLTAREVRDRFTKELRLNNITTVSAGDLEVEPTQEGYHLIVEYSVKKPLWRQISLVMDFKAERQSK